MSEPGATRSARRDPWLIAAALLAIVFGLVTIRAGGRVLLGNPAALAEAGHYVPFVLWFNFVAGFAYVLAGIGMWLRRRWAVMLAMVIAAATVVVFAAFGLHVALGGAWESRTMAAMPVRSLVWIVLAWLAARRIPRAAGGVAG